MPPPDQTAPVQAPPPTGSAQLAGAVAQLLMKLCVPDVQTAYEHAHRLGQRVWELAGDMEPDNPNALRGSLLERAVNLLGEDADDALRREQWAAALRWEADQLREATDLRQADASRYYAGVLTVDAHRVEAGQLTPWSDAPEPVTPPAQPAHTAPAGDDGHPGTPDGPAVLGRALLAGGRDGGHLFLQVEDGKRWHNAGWGELSRAEVEAESTRVEEVLLVRPEVGRVLEAAQALVAQWTPGRWSPQGAAQGFGKLETELAASLGVSIVQGVAVDALDQPTTGGPDHDGLTGARVIHDRPGDFAKLMGVVRTAQDRSAEAAPEPAGDGPGWVDRRGWTRQQWLEDTRAIFYSVHGGAADLLNGHIMALFGELHAVTEQRDLAIAHDRQPNPTADAYERTCAALEKHRKRAEAAEAELEEVRDQAARARDLDAELAEVHDRVTVLEAALNTAHADRDRWRKRAELAEAQVDGQAWQDLEAERDRLRRQLADRLRADLGQELAVTPPGRPILSLEEGETDAESVG